MGCQQILVLSVTIAVFITLLYPSTYLVNAQSSFIKDFCLRRQSTEDRAFCLKIFKPKPVSETAKDNPTMLKIALDMTIAHATRTHNFMEGMEENTTTNVALKPLLKQCISAYKDGLTDLKSIVEGLEDDPPMSSYYAQMANDELSRCDTALNSGKMPNADEAVSIMHKIGMDYSKLCIEIAEIL